MALSPWPTTPMAMRMATAELKMALGLGVNESNPIVYDSTDLEIRRLGGAVAARVEEYAPRAPDVVKDEAVIRGCAWLRDTRGAVSSSTVGPLVQRTAVRIARAGFSTPAAHRC